MIRFVPDAPVLRKLAFALLLSVSTAVLAGDAPLPVLAEMVTPRVFYVVGQAGAASAANQGFMSNAGFVVTDEGVVVFDTLGTPALAGQLIARIREKTSAPIRRVIVSHFHPDHFYGLAAFRAAGAEIWAHRAAVGYLDSEAARERLSERRRSLAPYLDSMGEFAKPDHYIDGESEFTLGGIHFRLLPAGPAHTPEDLVMLVDNEAVLFVGDLVFGGRLPFVGTGDSATWLASLERLLALRPRFIISGHGRHSANAETDLRLTRDYLTDLRKAMGDAVANLQAFDEADAAADWSAYRKLPLFAETHRINAYNTYLRMEQEALNAGAKKR